MEYAQTSAILLDGLVVTTGGAIGRSAVTTFKPPTLDPSVVALLRNVIENGDAAISDALCVLISDIQIFSANLLHVEATVQPGSTSLLLAHNVLSYMLRAAVISARTAELFPYARRTTDKTNSAFPSERELLTALRLMGFDDSTHPALFSEAERVAKLHADHCDDGSASWALKSWLWFRSKADRALGHT